MSLVRRPEDEVLMIPEDEAAWGAARDVAKAMGG